MSRDLASLLDECLAQIKEEKDIERCLSEHPEAAAELRPALQLAWQLRALRPVPPRSAQAIAAGRERFLAQAAAMQQAQMEKRTPSATPVPWQEGLLRAFGLLKRGLATAAVTIALVVVFLGGGAWVASARSVPGDPLYSVKLVRERVILWLTFDQESKLELQQELEARRIEETKILLREGRSAQVEFKGTIERISEGTWLINGVTVTVPSNIGQDESFADGVKVEIVGKTLPDGTVLVDKVEVQPTPTVSITLPTPTSIPATATALPVATATLPPTMTPLPTATDTLWPTKPPEPTATLTPTASRTRTATPEPTSTRTRTQTPSPTLKPTHTSTPVRIIKLQVEGSISRIEPNSWEVGGQLIWIDGNTVIDKRGGAAEVGAWARVIAVRRDDGSLLALEIIIERPAERPPEGYEFQGIIELFSEAEWIIGGNTVRIVNTTVIEGAPVIGWVAQVRALKYPSGALVATFIRVIEPIIVVQFEGTIESVAADQWIVDGRTLLITPETRIEGTPVVGGIAEIEAVLKPDGTLIARWIRVYQPPTPSPTDTPLPTPTPWPTAIQPPTATPPATATVSSANPGTTQMPPAQPSLPVQTKTALPRGTPPSLFTGDSWGK